MMMKVGKGTHDPFSMLFIGLTITQSSRLVSNNTSITISQSQNLLPKARRPLLPQQSIRHILDPCNIICPSCGAPHWIQERSYRSTINNPLFFNCCQRGQISLPHFPDAPEPLKSLLQDDTDGNSLFIYEDILLN